MIFPPSFRFFPVVPTVFEDLRVRCLTRPNIRHPFLSYDRRTSAVSRPDIASPLLNITPSPISLDQLSLLLTLFQVHGGFSSALAVSVFPQETPV